MIIDKYKLTKSEEIFYRKSIIFNNYKKKEEFIINKIYIWASESNILRMKKANHFFIDGTFIRPTLYLQTIIVMYIDIITGYKIPGIYALLSNKNLESYNALLEYVSQIIKQKKIIK